MLEHGKDYLPFSYVDDGELYKKLRVPKEVLRTASGWISNPSSIPNGLKEDAPEQSISTKSEEAVRSFAAKFREDELIRKKSRDTLIVDPNEAQVIRSETVSDLYETVVSHEQDTWELTEKKRIADQNLSALKEYHDVDRNARYAVSIKPTILLATILLLFEALVTGVLLSDIVTTGFIGGLALALLVGIANILLGGVSGYFCMHWIFRRGRSKLVKCIGGGLFVTLAITTTTLNLAMAYVRSHGLENLSTDLSLFWKGDIALADIESMALFIIGQLVFVWSVYKFQALKDYIPDLEKADRELSEVVCVIGEKKSATKTQMANIARISTSRFGTLDAKLKSQIGMYRSSLSESRTTAKLFHDGRRRIIQAHRQCILNRRSALLNSTGIRLEHWRNSQLSSMDDYMDNEFDVSLDETRLVQIEEQTQLALTKLHEERKVVEEALRLARENISKTERKDSHKSVVRTAGAEIIALRSATP